MDGLIALISLVGFLFKLGVIAALIAGIVLLIKFFINTIKLLKEINFTLYRIEAELKNRKN